MKKRNALLIGVISFIVLGGALGVGAINKVDDNSQMNVIDDNSSSPTTTNTLTNVSTDDSSSTLSQEVKITQGEAIAIALKESPGTVTKAELDEDNEYEIEIQDGNKEYDYEINAITGEIRERDTDFFKDRDDD